MKICNRFKNFRLHAEVNMELLLMSEKDSDQVSIYHINSDNKKVVLGSGTHPNLVKYLAKNGKYKSWVNIIFKDYIYVDIDIFDEDLYAFDTHLSKKNSQVIILGILVIIILIALGLCLVI
jgi:hypothetical protein